jgi:tetratricopeptide (TPR) repeat protein
MKTRVALVLVAAMSVARSAAADTPPNPWESIKHPEQETEWRAHIAFYRTLMKLPEDSERIFPAFDERVREEAKGYLLRAGAEKSPHPLLRFDLGFFYMIPRREMPQNAVSVLEPAIAMAPDDPGAIQANWRLSVAYAKLGRTDDEKKAYERQLQLEYEPENRLVTKLNLAEAEMRLGHLDAAIAQYRAALEEASSLPNTNTVQSSTVGLTWGLAVALDRNGDAAAARAQTKAALSLDPGLERITDRDSFFFVPEYERLYYIGMGAIELARQSPRAESWLLASRFWKGYVDLAAPDDRWLPMARAHLAECDREHKAALKRSATKK